MAEPRVEYLTAAQRAALEAELAELEGPRRAAAVAAIKHAREFGDLSENFEYHAAKNEQGLLEARIRTLRSRLDHAEIVEDASGDEVGIGSRVRYRDDTTDKVTEVTVVHPLEASVPEGKLSAASPIGKALLGASKGGTVSLETPRGAKQLEILDVA